jgi:CheY-like chemotaxis protein
MSRALRVLLAEDNAFVAELFRHALRKLPRELGGYAGHDLVTAQTGHEALRVLEQERLDAVILDHYLPGITGCAIVRRLRSMPAYRDVPVVVVSMGGEEVRKEALEAGATLLLEKPLQATQLLDTLRALPLGSASSS